MRPSRVLMPRHATLRLGHALILSLASAAVLRGQPAPDPPVHDGARGETRVYAPRLDGEVAIDGRLDEPQWARAARLTGFTQYAPADGRPAEDETEVLVWYSAHAIHFGIRAREAHGAVHATLADRDRISGDDYVEILLGTFHNGRQATLFAVNPLGIQADGVLNEVGATGGSGLAGAFSSATVARESASLAPDFVFDSRGRVLDDGYEVEVRIPFKSLRYPSATMQTWHLQVVRHVQHAGREDTWAPARRSAPSFLAQSGELVDLADLRRGIVLDVNPEATFRVPGVREGEDWSYDAESPDVGVNVRWGVTSDLTLNGTVRPDFSQVETDVAQFSFDPRNALQFPEKRPFFLEAIELFDVPNRLIYTRRIVQPLGAAKLSGKLAGTEVGLLSAVDEAPAGSDDHPLFHVLRLQRNVFGGSRVGVVVTDRRQESLSNQVVGLDGRFVFAGDYALRFQGAMSRTRSGDFRETAPLWDVGLTRGGRGFGFRMGARGTHEDFRALSGFVSRPGVASAFVAPRYTLYAPPGGFVESVTGEVRIDGTWRHRDLVAGRASQDRKTHINLNGVARGGWRGGVSLLVETFGYDPDIYRNYRVAVPREGGAVDTLPFVGTPRLPNLDWVVNLTTPEFRHFSGSLFVLWGKDENFHEWASADIVIATLSADWRPTERLRVGALYQHQQVDRRTDGSTVELGRIPRLKLEYQVTRAIFVRLVGQYSALEIDALRDDSRTGAPILILNPVTGVYEPALARSSNELRTDVLFAYKPTPGTTVFAGYGNTSTEPEGLRFDRLERREDAFFMKLSYLHRL